MRRALDPAVFPVAARIRSLLPRFSDLRDKEVLASSFKHSDASRAEEPDVLSATLTLDDAKPLNLELQIAGATFHQGLRTEPWGARTFVVSDPDGNLILSAGQAG